MRRFLVLFLILSMLLVPAMAQAEEPIRLFVGTTEVKTEVAPVLEGGTTLVPLRALTEALGYTLTWEASTQTITLTKADLTIVLVIDQKTALVNGKTVELLMPPTIRDNRTLIPARFVAEQMGATVTWDSVNRVVNIAPPAEQPATEQPATAGIDPAVEALLAKVEENKNVKATGEFTTTITSAMGSMVMKMEMEIYTKGDDMLMNMTMKIMGMEQKAAVANYQGHMWTQDPSTGTWVKSDVSLEDLATQNPMAFTEISKELLASAKLTASEQSYEGTALSVVTVELDLEAMTELMGDAAADMQDGTMKITYWITKDGAPHHMDLTLEMTAADGSGMAQEGTLFLQAWEEPIPFPAEILN